MLSGAQHLAADILAHQRTALQMHHQRRRRHILRARHLLRRQPLRHVIRLLDDQIRELRQLPGPRRRGDPEQAGVRVDAVERRDVLDPPVPVEHLGVQLGVHALPGAARGEAAAAAEKRVEDADGDHVGVLPRNALEGERDVAAGADLGGGDADLAADVGRLGEAEGGGARDVGGGGGDGGDELVVVDVDAGDDHAIRGVERGEVVRDGGGLDLLDLALHRRQRQPQRAPAVRRGVHALHQHHVRVLHQLRRGLPELGRVRAQLRAREVRLDDAAGVIHQRRPRRGLDHDLGHRPHLPPHALHGICHALPRGRRGHREAGRLDVAEHAELGAGGGGGECELFEEVGGAGERGGRLVAGAGIDEERDGGDAAGGVGGRDAEPGGERRDLGGGEGDRGHGGSLGDARHFFGHRGLKVENAVNGLPEGGRGGDAAARRGG
mmetsp:Transcript_4112/g.10688  ORF Transcript_4112/g.10688 Transcript_4112/m.10688 type:complete len:437 (-) Transcript_4112:126-1436(-)